MKMPLELYQEDNVNRDVQSYESVTYDGVEYCLHDCVIFYQAGEAETYIGKIVKIIDTTDCGKQLEVVWFFRPSEIRNYLGDYEPQWNEIFLASCEGEGLSNTNFLEAAQGKCSVVCISKDQRNPLPSKAELRSADYIFSCTFDVGKLTISRKFPNEIHGFRVENFFNKRKDRDLTLSPIRKPSLNYPTGMLDREVDAVTDDQKYDDKHTVKEEWVRPTSPIKVRCLGNENVALKFKSISDDKVQERISSGKPKEKDKEKFSSHFSASSPVKQKSKKKVRFSDEVNVAVTQTRDQVPLEPPQLNFPKDKGKNSNEASSLVEQDQATKTDNNADGGHWFKRFVTPWRERLQKAQERGTLVLLDNLDPTYSSCEVEEIVRSAFNERVEAKMVTQTPFSCPLYGKAFVIFKSKYAATAVINKLNRSCLMLTDQRPVLGCVGSLRKSDDSKLFIGHYKIKPKRLTEDARSAVATSHCSQENTIEYSMGMEWRTLQEKTERWWKQLHEKQAKEMMELKKQLRIQT
ncbi:protein ANTI-SILENCING 1 isoform X2 [Punica granatum]|uniref:Protein ANTI-SILENCING 1 isoform X2 n=1 Tax=Punica granatum TaxID=22663 RepID=A0A6P8EMJ1_PUNGR|nr:protein ANTI-SILENCING 1 isoform X2 [Punica granatum]